MAFILCHCETVDHYNGAFLPYIILRSLNSFLVVLSLFAKQWQEESWFYLLILSGHPYEIKRALHNKVTAIELFLLFLLLLWISWYFKRYTICLISEILPSKLGTFNKKAGRKDPLTPISVLKREEKAQQQSLVE